MTTITHTSLSSSPALDRGLSILKLFAEGDRELSVRDISQRLGIPQASSYRLVRTLTDHGYLRSSPRSPGKLELGFEILRLASMAREGSDLQSISAPIMQELTDATKETAVLVVPGDWNAVCVRVIEGTSPIRPRSARVGEHLPYNGGATPMAIFAYLDDAHRARVIDAGLRQYASRTPIDRDTIESMCREIRASGFAFSTSGYIEGTSAFAAPIFDADGRVQAAIGITGVSDSVRGFEHLVLDGAHQVMRRLGGVPPRRETSEAEA